MRHCIKCIKCPTCSGRPRFASNRAETANKNLSKSSLQTCRNSFSEKRERPGMPASHAGGIGILWTYVEATTIERKEVRIASDTLFRSCAAELFPFTLTNLRKRVSRQRLWHGADRLEEGQVAGGAEQLWQARCVLTRISFLGYQVLARHCQTSKCQAEHWHPT